MQLDIIPRECSIGLRPANGHETLGHTVIPSGSEESAFGGNKKQIPRFARNDRWARIFLY
jgi:hypothetical protein